MLGLRRAASRARRLAWTPAAPREPPSRLVAGCGGARRAAGSGAPVAQAPLRQEAPHASAGGGPRRLARAAAAGACGVGAALMALAQHGQWRFARLQDEGLPLTYEEPRIRDYWDAYPSVAAWRLSQIVNSVVPYLARLAFERFAWRPAAGADPGPGPGPGSSEDALLAARAAELRELLTRLGPAFIKLGQVLSTRPDLVPQAYLDELRKLCDAVPAFPTAQAVAIVRAELGAAWSEALQGLDDPALEPMAAASLGQVYRLRLRLREEERGGPDGRLPETVTVAVKVQRPDMLRAVSLDLYLLRRYGQALEALKALLMSAGVLSPRKQFDVALLDSFASASYLELDYCTEAANQERFRRELVPRMRGQVRVPRVFWGCTSRKVLTSEWIDGEQLVRSSPQTIKRLVPVGVECFLAQLLDVGFFHSDPHSANLLVDRQGRLCLIDFGLCARVPAPDMAAMTDAIVNLMRGDVPGLLGNAITLGFLPRDVDMGALSRDLVRIFAESKLKEDAAEALPLIASDYEAIESRRKRFREVSKELNGVFYAYPFAVPEYFALITRALIVLEGIAVVGDPAFDIFAAAYPYASTKVARHDLWRVGKAAMQAQTGRHDGDARWFDPRTWRR
jgi:predicted unusual protein kinase regulating ubiquinone biosynthesis (AarF/ABC1/UbiB family)